VLTGVCLGALGPGASPGQDAGAARRQEAARLIGVLRSDASPLDKATACRRLAAIGDKDAVPALAGLLGDERLATYARWALEGIPDPAAGDALRQALGRLEGPLLTGAIDSVGKRRDAQAADALGGLLAHKDRAVASAAARALGYVGSARSGQVLREALAGAAPDARAAIAGACLICAQRLPPQANREEILALCDAVRRADVPQHLVLAATYRAIVLRGKEATAMLAEELGSRDEARFRFALQAARDLGPDACGALTARFGKETPPRQVLLILALGDLGDRAALPVVLGAARDGAPEVRIEAIGALARFGGPAAVPTLLGASAEPHAAVAQAAQAALAVLDSREINAAIAGMLGSNDPKSLQVAVSLAGRRGIASATPALLKLAHHPDAAMRLEALKSLGSTVQLEDLEKLMALAMAPDAGGQSAAAGQALKAACARLPRRACTAKLAAAMAGASSESKVILLEHVAAVGGPEALEVVLAAARSDQDAIQDAATRLLGGWMTADAAPGLLDLAATLKDGKYRIRCLRGGLRIARQLDMTPEERLKVCRRALALAERNEEKALAVESLGRAGSPEALALAVSLLADKELSVPAASAIVVMAGRAGALAPEEAETALQRVLALPGDPALKRQAETQLARVRELARQHREEPQFTPLSDGKTLAGWEGDLRVFRVQDGAIVGGSLKEAVGTGNDFLCTKKEYRDFELRLQFKLLGSAANGGVNFRSKRMPGTGVASGYQADLGQGYWGSLYDEDRRNRTLAQAKADPAIRPDDWNDYRIRCEGRRIRLWLNGVETVTYAEEDANIALSGILALQIQANRPGEAWYRNLRIKEL